MCAPEGAVAEVVPVWMRTRGVYLLPDAALQVPVVGLEEKG